MNTLEAIYQRRSIRKFKPDAIPKELIEKMLDAAVKAPSASNRQPWRFVVLEGAKKEELIEIFQKKVDKLSKKNKRKGGVLATINVMKQAPVLVLVFNSKSTAKGVFKLFSTVLDVMDGQSIGAAIQNILLTARDFGLGTLWIGFIFYAVKEVCRFVNKNEELIAAISVGYPDESPEPRPRMQWSEVTEWLK